ncbi:MAG: reverse transcriptase-like protein [Candidatus Latescibacteria bacterium]|nr:reverse transcriptase-like protein [Candidatus Latescibacterota bacterium]NIM22166.1 reverse transcriptase-like protein [Candidatus Latescibacterota bacterium]NIM64716.1 reverse transcriptase-like protein [Candidatus Latescibacterota bacterium]NIO01226.1 reverse transcriptase-like protein [Candidatus Latescibacterota bacterium]NIO27611.1 reverse transcriptase-like protein [Candidatus Latescibacterota bacterium]
MQGEDLESARRIASLEPGDVHRVLEALRSSLLSERKKPEAPQPGDLSLVVFTDGASRGNPGEAACAVIVYDKEGSELLRRTRSLGTTTNNVAEYEGVILALEIARELGAAELQLKLDSELVVKQLNKQYKIKNPKLGVLYSRASGLMEAFREVKVLHISREENREADSLVNAALDGRD